MSPYINHLPVVVPMSRWTSTAEEIQIKGHTVCLKDFEDQTMSVAETLPLTCLYDGACWPAQVSNQGRHSSEMRLEAQITNCGYL